MKINDKIKTKRGYTGTIVDMVHMKDIRVVLDGCTYSDSHRFDILPLEDITVLIDSPDIPQVGAEYTNRIEKLLKMEIHEELEIDNHVILRVFGGWIYTDKRGLTSSNVFVPEMLNVESK